MRDRARQLRSVLTISERRLWGWLRNRTFCGYKFRRQFPAGRYVLDFYCAELQLAIEVDGQQHELPCVRQYDDARTIELKKLGIRMLRISNRLLATDPLLAAEQVLFAIREREAERSSDNTRDCE
jgi:very-short-patch-repair endonuclease